MANGAKDTFSSAKGILTWVKEAYGSEMCLIRKKSRLVVVFWLLAVGLLTSSAPTQCD